MRQKERLAPKPETRGADVDICLACCLRAGHAEALELLRPPNRWKPDLILLDIVMDGIERSSCALSWCCSVKTPCRNTPSAET